MSCNYLDHSEILNPDTRPQDAKNNLRYGKENIGNVSKVRKNLNLFHECLRGTGGRESVSLSSLSNAV
jgi:hypothetical protein